MGRLEVSILIVVGLIIGGTVYLYRKYTVPRAGPWVEKAETKPEKEPEPSKPKPKKKSSRAIPANASDDPVIVRRLVVPAPKPIHPFPTTADLSAGLGRESILEVYGPPSLKFSSVDHGRFMERYVYVRPDRGAVTYAYLVNAELITSDTVFR